MTTNWPKTPLEAIGADGAFHIGGGDFDFGQGYTESLIRNMFEVPLPTNGNAVEILTQQLSKMPLETLQYFKNIIPGTIDDDFIDIATAVATIIGNLANLPRALLSGEFDEWLATAFNTISTELRQILEILGGLVVTPINAAVQAVKDWFSSNMAGLNSALNNAGHALETAVGWVDEVWNKLTGRNETGVAIPAAGDQVAALAQTLAAHAARLADIDGKIDKGTGIAGGDDFERTNPSGVGPGWAEAFSSDPNANGRYVLTGHEAVWQDDGNNEQDAAYIRTDPADAVTLTDYQKVTLVTGTVVGEGPQFGSSSYDKVYGRVSPDGSKYVYALIGNGQARFFYKNGGAETALGPVVSTTQSAGSSWTLVCGTAADIREYQLIRNGSPILKVIDAASVTAIGPLSRGWGWGGRSGTRIAGQATPSSVTRVTVSDNAPGSVGSVPYDVNFMHSGAIRAVGAGDNPLGVRLQRPVTFSSVYYRCGTSDASGNLVVELRKNGATVPGSSVTLAAANQIAGAGIAGNWVFNAGDILTVYVTAVGATPGAVLVADIAGTVG